MTARAEWAIRQRLEFLSGTYYQINVPTSGREGAGTVTVKARTKRGPAYVCLSCLTNDCVHTRFVAEHDTPDAVAA